MGPAPVPRTTLDLCPSLTRPVSIQAVGQAAIPDVAQSFPAPPKSPHPLYQLLPQPWITPRLSHLKCISSPKRAARFYQALSSFFPLQCWEQKPQPESWLPTHLL